MGSVVQPQQQQKQCPVCYDDVQDDWPTLPCGHVCCRPCLQQWFLTEEKTGQAAPTCPLETCRKAVNDATAVLGRAFVPAGSNNNKKRKRDHKDDDDDTMDTSTKAWLEANTLECGGCQGRITKSSGCDKLQCICGYRICWKCRKVGAQCGCNPGHGFVDNVTGLPSWSRATTVANESQLQNMKQFLEDRRKERPRNTLLDMFGSSGNVVGELRSQRRSRLFGPGGGDPWSPSRMAAKMRHMYPTAAAAVPAKRPRPSPNSLFGMTTSWRAASGPLPFPFWGATPTAASAPPSTTASASIRTTDSSNSRDPPSSSSVASFPAARPFLSSMMMPSTSPSQPQHLPNDLLRPTLFRDLPDIFGSGGSTADAELRRALHLSLMEPTNTAATTTTALAATRHAAAAAFPLVVPPRATSTWGSTAAHPIRVDDDDDEEEERINISSRKLVPPAAPQKKRPAALRRRSRNQEYEDDMEKAIRLSLLESGGSNSGGTALNPVCVDEADDVIDGNNSNEEKKDDEMDSKPAAVITRQVTAETTLGLEARTTTSEATAVEKA